MAPPRGAWRGGAVTVVIGLGNPGEEYARTRHNLGWLVADEVAARLGWRWRRASSHYLIAAGGRGGAALTLLKPTTFMNRSGDAWLAWAGAAAPGEATDAAPPVAVCDDIALPLGTVRIRARGGTGGHRGLESLAAAWGGDGFPRVRLGCAGREGGVPPQLWADYVLAPIPPGEWEAAREMVARAAAAVLALHEAGLEAATARFNGPGPAPAAAGGTDPAPDAGPGS